MSSSLPVATLGTPRIGPRRELKFALESFWSGKLDESELLEAAAGLRAANWARQKALGVDRDPVERLLALRPRARHQRHGRRDSGGLWLERRAGAARDLFRDGARRAGRCARRLRPCASRSWHGHGVPALEMTKWFDTNYHYMVPELHAGQTFALASRKPVDEYRGSEGAGLSDAPGAARAGHLPEARQERGPAVDPLSLLDAAAAGLCRGAARARRQRAPTGCRSTSRAWCSTSTTPAREALRRAYAALAEAVPQLKIMLATYFGALGDNLDTALGAAGRRPASRSGPRAGAARCGARDGAGRTCVLSLGVIDGRNIWRADLRGSLDRLEPVDRQPAARTACSSRRPARCCTCRSISTLETELDPELQRWLAFAVQKIERTGDARPRARRAAAQRSQARWSRSDRGGRGAQGLAARSTTRRSRRASQRVDADMRRRASAVRRARAALQRAALRPAGLPDHDDRLVPADRRGAQGPRRPRQGRAERRRLRGLPARRDRAARSRWQEEIGLDVLVHGEFERNDMVQYFGEQLAGFAFTQHGWVQILRLALRPAADPLRRRLAARSR